MTVLSSGATLTAAYDYLLISFSHPMDSLSTAIWGGGCRKILWALNQKLTVFYPSEEDFPGGSVPAYLRLSLLAKGCDPEKSAALLTSARMEWFKYVKEEDHGLTVEIIATAGVEKTAARAGEPAFYREEDHHFYPAGTINLMALVSGTMPPGIMARALITITEGKTAALQDLGIASVSTGRPATGTATDGITLITDPSGPTYTDAGTFAKLGELLASATHKAVTGCLVDFDRPWNRDARLETPKAVDVEELKKNS